MYPGLGNDEVDELQLVLKRSFINRTGGNVNLVTTLEPMASQDRFAFNPVTVRRIASAPDIADLSWEPVPGAVRYEVYAADRAGQPLSADPFAATTETAVELDASRPDVGRSYAVVTIDGEGRRHGVHGLGIGPPRYVALGDSFSAGEGLPNFEPDTNGEVNDCHRSLASYSRLLSEDRDLASRLLPSELRACSGATTFDFFDPQAAGQAKQRDYARSSQRWSR